MSKSVNSQMMARSATYRVSSPPQSPTDYNLSQNFQGMTNDFLPPSHRYIEEQKFSSAFFRDNNEEQYVIQRAFKANNFISLRDLPDNITRNCILEERYQRVKEKIQDESIRRMRTPLESEQARQTRINEIKKTKIGTLGYFQAFTYQESNYQLPKKLAAEERLQSIQKRKQIVDIDFRPAGFDKKMKYQDPFRYVDRINPTTGKNQKYLFPFHLPEDTFDSFKQNEKRRKKVAKQRIVAGEFYPSKAQKSLSTVNKRQMPQILDELEFYLKKFLKGQPGYFIGVNKRDHIELFFEVKYKDDTRLNMAISGMCEHQMLSKFQLRKNYKRWGSVNQTTNYLQFVVLPPWVKQTEQLTKATFALE